MSHLPRTHAPRVRGAFLSSWHANETIVKYFLVVSATGNPKRKASVFLGGTVADDTSSFSDRNGFMVIQAFGLLASRPHDRMGVSGWYTSLSDDFKDVADDLGLRLRETWSIELYYNVTINPWLHLTPDLQCIRNERQGDDIAVIPGGGSSSRSEAIGRRNEGER